MNTFADELLRRITGAREALRTAQDDGDLDAERVYAGELESLLRLAHEHDLILNADRHNDDGPHDEVDRPHHRA